MDGYVSYAEIEQMEDISDLYIVFEEDSPKGKMYDLCQGIYVGVFNALDARERDQNKSEEKLYVAKYADYIEGSYDPIDSVSVKMLMDMYGYGIKRLSTRFKIPYRTIQNWTGGQRECPEYIIRMMDEILRNDKRK